MRNFEKAVLAANFYEKFSQDKKSIKSYLEASLSSIDAVLVINEIKSELDKIQDLQDITAHQKALEYDENAIPKRVEIIVNENIIADAQNLPEEKISTEPKHAKQTLQMLSIVAYKYQLKYTVTVLESMLLDEEIWTDVTFH